MGLLYLIYQQLYAIIASVTSLCAIAVYNHDLYYQSTTLVAVHFACLFYNSMCYTCISCLFRESLLSVYFQALMRPGRLDRILYVPLPDLPTRRQIFTIHLNRMPTGSTVDVDKLVTATGKYSGAEVIFAQQRHDQKSKHSLKFSISLTKCSLAEILALLNLPLANALFTSQNYMYVKGPILQTCPVFYERANI